MNNNQGKLASKQLKHVYFMGSMLLHAHEPISLLNNCCLPVSVTVPFIPMPPYRCVYGCWLHRGLTGRVATDEQLQQAAVYHHPQPVTSTWICDKHRKMLSTATSQKRQRSPSPDLSHSSSDANSGSSSKRLRTAEILSSLSQTQPLQSSNVANKTDASTSATISELVMA